MDILVTDLTSMNGGMFCLAGWVFETNRMVRPLPGGNNWSSTILLHHDISTGCVIRVVPEGNHTSGLPHSTEDLRISERLITVLSRGHNDWLTAEDSPITYNSVSNAFDNQIALGRVWQRAHKASVADGTNCKSLAGIRLPSSSIAFFSDQYEDRPATLRAQLTDGDRTYNLPVSCKKLRELFNAEGFEAAQRSLPVDQDVHIRLGLARAFNGNPCSIMLNGIHW